jgi:MFS family permease
VAFGILLLPYSLIGPFAGVFLDRWLRRNILVRANLLKALLTIPVIAAVLAGNESVVLGISVLAVLGVGRFILAGLSASLPHVVKGKELIYANALTPTSGTIAFVIGATTGLGIRQVFGGGDTGSVALLMFAIGTFTSAAFIARTFAVHALGPTHQIKHSMVDSLRGVTGELVSGVRTLGAHGVAAKALALVAVNRISFGVVTAGALLLLRNTFHQSSNANAALADFAILSGSAATAALLAAIVTPWMTRQIGIPRWSSLTVAQASAGMVVFACAATLQNFPLLIVAGFSLGFAGQAVKVCSDTVIQREIPDESLGRIFSLFDMSVNVALVSGIILVALLAPVSGVAPMLYAGVGIGLALASFWYWRAGSKNPV